MTQAFDPGSTLEKFCNTAIEQRLGDISGLPEELVAFVRKVYRDFITALVRRFNRQVNMGGDFEKTA